MAVNITIIYLASLLLQGDDDVVSLVDDNLTDQHKSTLISIFGYGDIMTPEMLKLPVSGDYQEASEVSEGLKERSLRIANEFSERVDRLSNKPPNPYLTD